MQSAWLIQISFVASVDCAGLWVTIRPCRSWTRSAAFTMQFGRGFALMHQSQKMHVSGSISYLKWQR